MSGEVLILTGYALALLIAAFVLEKLSIKTHARSREYRVGGFEYEEHHDYWVCQQGEQLWPAEFDREKRLVRYKAKSSACRTCAIKHLCTDSDDGREITRPIDPWPHSEAGRFHRGIAVMITALAVFVLLVETVRHHSLVELALLAPALAVAGYATWWLARDLIRTPTGFPEAMPAHGNRLGKMVELEADQVAAGDVLAVEPGVPRFGKHVARKGTGHDQLNGVRPDKPERGPSESSLVPEVDYGLGTTITAE